MTRWQVTFAVNSAIAWLAIGLDVVLTVGNVYPVVGAKAGDPGFSDPGGIAGVLSRTVDVLSYFTTCSVVLVGITTAMLALRRDSSWLPWLRVTSLVMITVTGVVQALLLAPVEDLVGWQRVADALEHQVTPIVTLGVWLIGGPHGWFSPRAILNSLVIPVLWIGYSLVRGVVTGVYPYDFINPDRYGYGDVLLTLGEILVFGVVVGVLLWGLDRVRVRMAPSQR